MPDAASQQSERLNEPLDMRISRITILQFEPVRDFWIFASILAPHRAQVCQFLRVVAEKIFLESHALSLDLSGNRGCAVPPQMEGKADWFGHHSDLQAGVKISHSPAGILGI